ncbi:ABC transporter substrate-binding protein [Aequorivita marina]|uniref:ABC transporter substrate-binding protein n=1 Tax=Aequorivita marina TaxID=3073654 RepID=UPI002874DC8D|nr:helical backbone metal receptor [Aequorivita sp. S2608]MDS1299306.1 helical backbone metal receptor [Aequorivita sp. S2608]
MEFLDQLHRTLNFKTPPSRIVSLVPSQTELLVDLGLEEQLVGVTKFCVHPRHLRSEKLVVGGTKSVKYDKIKTLNPDIIICNKEENTKEMVLQLEKIAPVWISDVDTIADSIAMIDELGRIFDVSDKAEAINTQIRLEIQNFQKFIKNQPKRKALYLIWKDPYMAAGRATFINEMLRLNNFENSIATPKSRYPEVKTADFKNVDLVLLSTEPYPFKEEHVLNMQGEIDAEVRLVDGEYFSWYGSRLQKAFKYFKSLHEKQ